MQHYWRLKDIPELRDVAANERSTQWREAVTRSFTVRGMFALMLLYFLGFTGGNVLASWVARDSVWVDYGCSCLIVMVLVVASDHWWLQPRARRWLQAHPVPDRQAQKIA